MMKIDKAADSFILSETELKLLLSALGYTMVLGGFSCDCPVKTEIMQTIAKMLREEKLLMNGDAFSVNPVLEEMIRPIGDSRKVVQLRFSGKAVPCEYYPSEGGETGILCSPSPYKTDMIRLKSLSIRGLADYILSDEAIQDIEDKKRSEEETLWEKYYTAFTMDIYTDRQKIMTLKIIYTTGDCGQISITDENENESFFPYSRENLEKTVTGLLS